MATKSGDQGLRDWFGKSKSSDGKPGWVQLGGKFAGKPCARQPGQTSTPKCGSSKMAANLSDEEEERARRRKNRQDPNQPEKSGGAKPTNVRTEGMDIQEVKDKPGKGSGKKDACYHKVKSRYSVWPSAYASGALVKCRKVGADNWGNKSESYEFSNWRDDFQATEYEFVDIIKPEPITGSQQIDENVSSGRSRLAKSGRVAGKIVGAVTNTEKSKEFEKQKAKDISNDKSSADKVDVSGLSPAEALTRKRQAERKAARERIKSKEKAEKERFKGGRFGRMREEAELDEKCWDGYTQQGMKKKGKKVVPNCVPVGEEKHTPTKSDLEANIGGGNLQKLSKKASKRIDYDVDGDVDSQDKVEKSKGEYGEELPTPFGKFRTGDSKKVKVKKEEFSDWREELSEASVKKYCPKCKKVETKSQCAYGPKYWEDNAEEVEGGDVSEDWQKVNKSDKTDGMSPAAVKAYRRENPGSKLKTAVTGDPKPGSKDAKRRKSFCARSKGQQDMHNIDCSKTPDKPVCKARRRWKC